MGIEILKFMIYSVLIVLISKYILVTTLRKLAENLNMKPKNSRKGSWYCNFLCQSYYSWSF